MFDDTQNVEEEMGIFSIDGLDDVEEPQLVDAGDYTLEIMKAEPQVSKAGNSMVHVQFRILDANIPNANLIHTYLNKPTAEDDDQTKYQKKLAFKRFFSCFNIDWNQPVDLATWEGRTGKCGIGIQKATDQYPASNKINRYHKAN